MEAQVHEKGGKRRSVTTFHVVLGSCLYAIGLATYGRKTYGQRRHVSLQRDVVRTLDVPSSIALASQGNAAEISWRQRPVSPSAIGYH